jgi:DNA-binding PadR family transcriptional regulator
MHRRHRFDAMYEHDGDLDLHHNRRGPHGHGRHRARRGALVMAVIALLDDRPMHGYELITELEQRSGGRWKPSPGAIYPALGKLEGRGLIGGTDDDGRRIYHLTEAGKTVARKLAEHGVSPWDQHDLGEHGDLRRAISELAGPAQQIGRFGTPEQTAAAEAAVKQATAALYRILADGPAHTSAGPEGEPDH